MHLIHIRHIAISIMLVVWSSATIGQDNVGIGTATPHPSAILEITDSSRGVLIPRTDTVSVMNYVSSLSPPTDVADGLMIMDTNVNTYVYYDAVLGKWRRLIGLVGPTGPKGFPGPTGPRGDTGLVTNWRDSVGFDQKVLGEDTCGDWFYDISTGKIWRLWCDTLGGTKPRRWIDTVSYDNYIGELHPPNEIAFASNFHSSSPVIESMANSTDLVSMVPLSGLASSFFVERDEAAYLWIAAFGTVSKVGNTPDIGYAQYDITISGGTGGNFYRDRLMQHVVTIGPDGPPSNTGLNDFVGWNLSAFTFFEGPKSPYPCGPCGPSPACTLCTPMSGAVGINVTGGNRYSASNGSTLMLLSDDQTKENVGHMSVFGIVRRNPNTWPWKQ